MKSSTKLWLWFVGIVLFILALLATLCITTNTSWAWFFGFLVFFILAGLVIGLVLLLTRKSKEAFPKKRLHPKTAIEAIRNKLRMDEDNPDELIIDEEFMPTEGQPGAEKTTMLHVKGRGYWSNQILHFFIDLDDISRMQIAREEPSQENLKELQRSFALNPTIEETEQEDITSPETGKVVRTIIRKKQTLAQKKEEKEKKEAEEKEAL
jgi:hypothetical protein